MNLLLRFYDPNSGVIKIDGSALTEVNVRWLRSHIGYVGQGKPIHFVHCIVRAGFGVVIHPRIRVKMLLCLPSM